MITNYTSITTHWIIKVTLLLVMVFAWSMAMAQTPAQREVLCFNSDKIITELQTRYEEQPMFVGSNDTEITVLFANPDKMSWTLVEIKDSQACVIAAGKKHIQVIINIPGSDKL